MLMVSCMHDPCINCAAIHYVENAPKNSLVNNPFLFFSSIPVPNAVKKLSWILQVLFSCRRFIEILSLITKFSHNSILIIIVRSMTIIAIIQRKISLIVRVLLKQVARILIITMCYIRITLVLISNPMITKRFKTQFLTNMNQISKIQSHQMAVTHQQTTILNLVIQHLIV